MKLKEILTKMRNDFIGIFKCEHCEHEEKIDSGYDDTNYHTNVIPSMKCKNCDLSTNDILKRRAVENKETDGPDLLTILAAGELMNSSPSSFDTGFNSTPTVPDTPSESWSGGGGTFDGGGASSSWDSSSSSSDSSSSYDSGSSSDSGSSFGGSDS